MTFSSSAATRVTRLAFSTKAREVTMVFTSAAVQAERMLPRPAVKLIMAGTRPAEMRPRMVTAAPLALGSMTPTAPPTGASAESFRPSTLAPASRRR